MTSNVFDQFDEPKASQVKPNVFDQFDEPSPKEKAPPQGGSIANSLANGVTFGFADEILALPMAAVAKLVGDAPEGATFGEVYQGMRDQINSDREAFAERNPNAALAGEIGGALLTGGTGLAKVGAKVAKEGANRAVRAGANAAVGAAEGALAGAGNADGGNRLEGAATGALVGAGLGAAGGEIANIFKQKSATKNKIAEALKEGSTDRQYAKYILDGRGKLKDDKLAAAAIGHGFDEGVVAAIKGASKADKQKMLQMVDVMQRAQNDKLFGLRNRASDVAGDSLLERIKYVQGVNRTAGRKIDQVAGSLKGQKVDFEVPVQSFLDNLKKMDIQIDPRTMQLNYKGSVLEGLNAPQRALNRVMLRMRGNKSPDAHDLHRLKKYIDESVSFDKSANKGVSAKVENALKSLRHNLDQALDTNFPEYNKVNTSFSETRNALDMLQKGLGPSVNLDSVLADKSVGKALRKIMSNGATRENLLDGMDEIERIAKSYYAKPNLSDEIGLLLGPNPSGKFEDDLMTQVLFADELDDVFGATARTSLQGALEKAKRSGAAAKDAVDGNPTNILGQGMDWVAEKLSGDPYGEKKYAAIRELLTAAE